MNISAPATVMSTPVNWTERLASAEYGQSHIIKYFQDKNSSEDFKKSVFATLDKVEAAYPGGVLSYIQRARQFVKAAVEGINVYEGYSPSQPLTIHADPLKKPDDFFALESTGLENIKGLCFVLVAGGLGERLGYPGIKLSLPTEVVTQTSYLQYYVENIKAIETYVREQTGKENCEFRLPLAIMTSDDTYSATLNLLKEHNNFGLCDDQLTVMKQEKVPSIADCAGRFVVDELGLQTKPHGHGDVHQVLLQHDLPSQWLSEGRTHMVFIQDTNSLIFRLIPAMLAASVREQLAMVSACIGRLPEENVGAVCKLTKGAEELTINVEYNQLAPMLAAAGLGGDTAGPNGLSPFPGNTNSILFNLKRYDEIMKATGGNIPEFVNPKFADATKTSFKSPTRLECMMQEYPRLLDSSDKVGCVLADRFMCFTTCKNSNADARVKLAAKGMPECAFSAEADLYASNVKILEIAAHRANVPIQVEEGSVQCYDGIAYNMGPRLVVKPKFAFCLTAMVDRLRAAENICIKKDDCIVLDVDSDIKSIREGTLSQVSGSKTYVQNHKFVPAGDSDRLAIKIRGYKHVV